MSTAAFTLFDAGGRSAIFSPCRTWRYELRRTWQPAKPAAMFVGLNPSTADELHDDRTVKRCMTYARDWGYGGLIMTNLFGYRATDPRVMKAYPHPIGPENDAHLQFLAAEAGIVIAAWGNHGTHRGRAREVLAAGLLGDFRVLALTANDQPNHPLYLDGDLAPITIEEARQRRDAA
ncbi:hypothetical protein C8N24_0318 [Solirubrobacter pauli]|uniref:DUF1643 domain-containing protein n=1 Tax=Solirubrobacter pauli TaxID=166793 RepID=A0A660L9D3_9ACTN|nr:DUF1643 domain-containing protein [Solirubrobacter pauli]RKQ90513.1 hypothetical protein C8N24_0318 [Solirubrobacter pauli]